MGPFNCSLAESSLGSAWGRCELKERLEIMGVQQGGCKHGYIGHDEAKIADYSAVGQCSRNFFKDSLSIY